VTARTLAEGVVDHDTQYWLQAAVGVPLREPEAPNESDGLTGEPCSPGRDNEKIGRRGI
jgi:hypothetical protein